MTTASTTPQYAKLKALLQELFQLDQPDLDFGLYRVMHAKREEVTTFLDRDLLPQVQAAFAQYQSADKAEIERELAKVIAGVEAAGLAPDDSPKVKELRARLANEAVDVRTIEREVYDHLYSFFRRYYSEGDYLAKRVYKPGVYAIPYEGEEVTLHWANKDQYYIKTSEYLRDYAFRLRPHDEANPMRVHFRLVDAAEGEHGNVKVAEGKERRFKLAAEQPLAVENDELVVRFTYQPDARKQAELNAEAEAAVLANADAEFAKWVTALKASASTEKDPKRTVLAKHLKGYSDRNTFDYFIHKDLGGFLRRELDFYIKNEVMHLDDVENETAPRVEQYLSKIKVVRRIAGKIIDFLAQLENFQKKLWLKKKFVVETSYCIRLGVIPEAFYPEIAANEAQREEWVRLCGIDSITGDLMAAAYSVPMTVEFLKGQLSLVVDTRHLGADFTQRLLDAVGDVDEQADGALVHSENFQALALMHGRYRDRVSCIYIDPPYNTGSDGFAYKDTYQHSSWLSMMEERLITSRNLLSARGAIFSSIDDREIATLKLLMSDCFGEERFVAQVEWQKRYTRSNNTDNFTTVVEHLLAYSRSAKFQVNLLERTDEANARFTNPDNDPRGPWKAASFLNQVAPEKRPTLCYPITNPNTGEVSTPDKKAWRLEQREFERLQQEGRLWWGRDGRSRVPDIKTFLSEVRQGMTPINFWDHEFAGNTDQANAEIKAAFSDKVFDTPKPTTLIERVCSHVISPDEPAIVLDYFAGSGTTGHAVINLNREDGGRRKFILVEMGDYFDTVLLPRIKKVTYTPEWKDGKPKRLATAEEAERAPRIVKVVRLESYEDALNNLETRRTATQQLLLDAPEAQGPDGLKEQYVLRYMLDVETRGSQSLLNVPAFSDPTAYTLTVKRPGSDESRPVHVDLLETFNWLLGLTVRHTAAPQTFSAAFVRDSEGRLRLEGDRIKQDTAGPYWFRTVTGTTPDGRKALVVWRKLTGGPEQDNLVLDEWFTKQGYSARDSEFDLIYVNGGNNLENLKTPDDRWKVQLIEEHFHRLMFEGTE
ncbi:MAG: site-specific DNA-methyltransferase [Gemmatimonas sp.]|jgi:adenine-specific DNA-methyltransferase|uniref:site-specific DNA-methyltransferase n=1 Tax=Gemmatimonas sp. TaxID=1962908 RepID=UPI00391FC0E7